MDEPVQVDVCMTLKQLGLEIISINCFDDLSESIVVRELQSTTGCFYLEMFRNEREFLSLLENINNPKLCYFVL
jgi:hypothetical protein